MEDVGVLLTEADFNVAVAKFWEATRHLDIDYRCQ